MVLRILTLSSLYPNAVQPQHGVFVEERLRHLLATGQIEAEVVAPVPWFPFSSPRFGAYSVFSRVPAVEERNGVRVSHPRFVVLPKIGMLLAPCLMALSILAEVRRALQRAKFDVIDAHYLYPDGVAAAIIAARVRKPFVLTARGSDVNVIMKYALARRMIMWAIKRAGHVVTVSGALRVELVKLGVDESRIDVLPNGVDMELFNADERPGRSGTRRNLLVVGQLKQGKGHFRAIGALRELPNCELDIVGDGPLRQACERYAATQGVANRVRFHGSVPHNELPKWYRAADALVLASEREGMPNVVLEALACGTPVVATRVGGIPEILADPVSGVMVESPESLVAGIAELLSRAPAPQRVRDYAERFSWETATRGQLAIFRGLAHKASDTASSQVSIDRRT